MTPRAQLVSAPYAFRVSSVDGASGGVVTGDIVIEAGAGGAGDLMAEGKATIGYGHTNSGDYSFVAGLGNAVTSNQGTVSGGWQNVAGGLIYSTVGGGYDNHAEGDESTIGGGYENQALSIGATVAGGRSNIASSSFSTIAGGQGNTVDASHSAILGGISNTIYATAQYSYLFGLESQLSADSTFMVDMPHVRFGDAVNGYEFPTEDGTSDQVLTTDGNGQLGWTDPSPGGVVGVVPIGSIIAWNKSLAGVPQTLPDGFVECSGQTLDDPESLLHAQIIPDLNGEGRFLRGSAVAGTSGGSEQHNHRWFGEGQYGSTWLEDGSTKSLMRSMEFNPGLGPLWPATREETACWTDQQASVPPFTTVVWIMRIK